MAKKCSVPNCRTAPGDRKSFYKFPLHDPERLDLWLRNMGRNRWTPSRHQYVCHQHFAPSNFKVCGGVRYLKNTAVPTLFQKEKAVGENESFNRRQANNSQRIKRVGLVTEAVGVQLGSILQSEQICDFGDRDPSQQDMNLATLKDQQTDVQGADMEELTCTIVDFSSVNEVDPTPDNAYFEVIPSILSSQTPQLTFIPETVLSSALSPQPITSTVPIVSKHVQSSKGDKSPDTEEEKEDDIKLDSSSFEHQQQVEHSYHKTSTSKEQLEATVVDLQRKVKILQQHHNSHLDQLQGLEKTVSHLRQSNLQYEERLQLLERVNIIYSKLSKLSYKGLFLIEHLEYV
uniref:THAP-type domain-containing protein n=1 Tax=Neogobius melanostomus TaxID=47308 RepID=A0A8C6T7K4_9GOBI